MMLSSNNHSNQLQETNNLPNEANDPCNSYSTCFRLLTSIYLCEIMTGLINICMQRSLPPLSPEEDSLLMIACSIPGLISGLVFWWSTGQVVQCMESQSDEKMKKIPDVVIPINSDEPPTNKKSYFWSFFNSCHSSQENFLSADKNEIKYGTFNN